MNELWEWYCEIPATKQYNFLSFNIVSINIYSQVLRDECKARDPTELQISGRSSVDSTEEAWAIYDVWMEGIPGISPIQTRELAAERKQKHEQETIL